MSTAEKAEKTAGHGAAWANLVVCGGISWAVSLWHATHPEQGTHPNTFLAILAATAPVVTAAFASHNVANKDAGDVRRALTCIVFLMGMALSVKAQAQSIGPIVGGTALGVVFALMLDVSTFISLSLIMSKPAPKATAEASTAASVGASMTASATPVGDASAGPSIERPRTLALDTPTDTRADTPKDAPTDTRRTRTKASPRTPAKTAKTAPVDTRAKARELLKENPDMNGNELAAALKRKPAGSIRTMRTELLEELRDAGELPSVRALGA